FDAAQAHRYAKNPARALELYRRFVERYPEHENAARARQRIEELARAEPTPAPSAPAPPPVAVPPPVPAAVEAPRPATVIAGAPAPAPAAPARHERWPWIALGAALLVVVPLVTYLAVRNSATPDATYTIDAN